jgi:uncharacterized protein (UPF0333 family)
MSIRHRKAQSTLEYVLLVTAVIVIIIGLLVTDGSPFKKALKNSLETGITGMENKAATLAGSHTTPKK